MYAMRVNLRLTAEHSRRFIFGKTDSSSVNIPIIRPDAHTQGLMDRLYRWPAPLAKAILMLSRVSFDDWMEYLLTGAPCLVKERPEYLAFDIEDGSRVIVSWVKIESLPVKYKVTTKLEGRLLIYIHPRGTSVDEYL